MGLGLGSALTLRASSLDQSAIVLAGTPCFLKTGLLGLRSWWIVTFPCRISSPTAQMSWKE